MAIPVALGVAAAAAAKGGAAAGGSGMLAGLGGGILSAGSSIFGGLLGSSTQEKLTQKQIDLQREFAQHGIRWRVEDAKAAGLHPLAALGAFPTHASPIIMEDPLGKSIADAGQDLSGAIARTQTEDERLSTRLNQDLIRAHIQESDMRSLAIQNDIQRKSNENPVPGFPLLSREPIEGQSPAIPSAGDPRGFFEFKPPPIMTPGVTDPSVQSGVSSAFERVQYPGFEILLPSGRGNENPLEYWNQLPAYEKWGIILYNARVQGKNWLRDFVNFGLTGRPGQGPNQKPFMDDYQSVSGSDDQIWKDIQRLGRKFGKDAPLYNPKGKGR